MGRILVADLVSLVRGAGVVINSLRVDYYTRIHVVSTQDDYMMRWMNFTGVGNVTEGRF